MELVEGPTLADRIAQGRMRLGEAVPIAQQIAEALEAAHEKGVIRRDLKPANIKLTPSGRAKVLDFGLAKMREAETSDATETPTVTAARTEEGVIFGTIAYMAPEQARGQRLDYGFSSITVPLALLFLSNRVLNPALVLVEAALNGYVLWVNRGALRVVWRRVLPITIGLEPGIAAGTLIVAQVSPPPLKLATYVALLPLILVQAAGYRRPIRSGAVGGPRVRERPRRALRGHHHLGPPSPLRSTIRASPRTNFAPRWDA